MKWLLLAIRRTWSIAKKEYVHILMDPGTLFLVIFAPAVVLTLLAYVFSYDVGVNNLVVVDLDQTPASQEYLRTLTSDGYLRIVAYPRSYDEAVTWLENSRADAALIIPPGFGEAISAGGYTPVHSVVDGVDTPAARQVMGAIAQRTHLFATRLGLAGSSPVEVRTRIWFNENLKSQHSMVPGLMALVLILPAMAAGLGIAREKESGTLETLVTTPVLGSDVLVGKVIVYLMFGIISSLVALGVGIFGFHVPFRGSLLFWIVATAAYLLACMGFSLVVANFTRSQQTAMVITLIVLFMPGFLMSGLTDPIDPQLGPSRILALLLPATHYITLSRGIALKGLGFLYLWRPAVTLLAMGLLGIGVAVGMFRKKIA